MALKGARAGHTAFASTTNGVSISAGRTAMLLMLKLSITIEERKT